MSSSSRPRCVLCSKSEEDSVTGALASKDDVTAHQNCLLYASGIYCKNSPLFDDLFGFSVEDVKRERRRGKKLCSLCKKMGATAGCEVVSCRRCYHYPCAVTSNARTIDNQRRGVYQLFCAEHHGKAIGSATPPAAQNGGAREGSKARPVAMSTVGRKRKLLDSDDEEDVLLIPPVESDLEDSPQPMVLSKGPENTTDRGGATTSSKQCPDMSSGCGLDGDETDIESDEASLSLLPGVSSVDGREPFSPVLPPEAPEAPGPVDAPADAPGPVDAPLGGAGRAEVFWRRCGEAGCTEDVFSRMTSHLRTLGLRIQQHSATAQDYDVALRVFQALGNSEEVIGHLEQEFEVKLKDLQQRREALKAARGSLTSTDQH
ncbi:histone-lysine N-methyltransferase 2A isoform X3 [Sardina pilchardus]|uniref:histone-lysine N-methyltransferase 2A isoform X3 n=1 Tax=Sardina pilchardus TaxID=27697 RepID=UPI002E0D2062